MKYYESPRWSGEILDCSMPMTFDTYDRCSYNCLYCFAYFQKSHSIDKGCTSRKAGHDYQSNNLIKWVNPERIKKLINLEKNNRAADEQFYTYIKNRKVIQWGGLADQFDEYERKHNISLELLKYFKEVDYPICFSTKGVWWLDDKRYTELFRGQDNWNCKFSIINLDEKRAKAMELGCPSPSARINAIKKYTRLNNGGATLRLRPFIIGFTDKNNEHLKLIEKCKRAGATAVSTEFFCLEARADDRLKKRYKKMSKIIGFDIYEFYKKYSFGSGYRRLTRAVKKKYIIEMDRLCKKIGMRFYVSDAHFKEYSHNGCCCGLDESWNYSRGQLTEALIIAKKKGRVYFKDIQPDIKKLHVYQWEKASGFNTSSAKARARRLNQTMYDYIRENWNTPNNAKSPYKYFQGILFPAGLDKDKNVIYEYRG